MRPAGEMSVGIYSGGCRDCGRGQFYQVGVDCRARAAACSGLGKLTWDRHGGAIFDCATDF